MTSPDQHLDVKYTPVAGNEKEGAIQIGQITSDTKTKSITSPAGRSNRKFLYIAACVGQYVANYFLPLFLLNFSSFYHTFAKSTNN